MKFTEMMIYNTIWIGDVVEQSIRYTNLEQFQKNQAIDKEKQNEYRRVKEELDEMQLEDLDVDSDSHAPHTHRHSLETIR